MATTAADGPPVELQSLKKLSHRSLKRSLDLFAPAHALLFTPDAESKRVRTRCKVRADYGAVKDLPPEQRRVGQGKGPAPPSSTALAMPGTQHTKNAHREGTSSAIIPAPLMLPKAPESTIPGKNTTLSIPDHLKDFSTSALMERIPSRWPRPTWHAPWKNYRYYPTSDFLSATQRRRSSATWKAILHGRDVLKRGLIYRIGPGNIDAWEENWIPGLCSLRPLVKLDAATAERVIDLFTPGTRVWDEQQVRNSFIAHDTAEVLKIKPSWQLESDIMAWAHERHRSYSVRSTYRLLKADQMAEEMAKTGETRPSGDDKAWRAVWKMNVPPKVRVFWWRVLHDSLPSKSELK